MTKVGLVVLLAVLSGAHWWTGREGFPLGQDMSRVLAWFGSGTLLFIPLFLARGVVSAPQVTTSEPQKKSRTEGQKATPLESP